MSLIPESAARLFIPGLEPKYRGKVRDTYEVGEDQLFIVAADRISAFDVVMPTLIPNKGRLLTALSEFWFGCLEVPNHLITTDVEKFPEQFKPFAQNLQGRSMLVRKATVFPAECIVRGYLAGSGWKEYQKSQTVCGIPLPAGLKQCEKLPEPIFTPSTKNDNGHDENITFDQMAVIEGIGWHNAYLLRDLSLKLYSEAAKYAAARGVIIADTKFEFGAWAGGMLMLIDEVLTPDSSRFWPVAGYEPGHDQPSFDKQFVRNYLEATGWDKKPPAPALPSDVVSGTEQRYIEAYEMLTDKVWSASAQ
jgi:phosphoribosylaminoimidazole-succinocarboxamide synthase